MTSAKRCCVSSQPKCETRDKKRSDCPCLVQRQKVKETQEAREQEKKRKEDEDARELLRLNAAEALLWNNDEASPSQSEQERLTRRGDSGDPPYHFEEASTTPSRVLDCNAVFRQFQPHQGQQHVQNDMWQKQQSMLHGQQAQSNLQQEKQMHNKMHPQLQGGLLPLPGATPAADGSQSERGKNAGHQFYGHGRVEHRVGPTDVLVTMPGDSAGQQQQQQSPGKLGHVLHSVCKSTPKG